jgi:hypothetical protein
MVEEKEVVRGGRGGLGMRGWGRKKGKRKKKEVEEEKRGNNSNTVLRHNRIGLEIF